MTKPLPPAFTVPVFGFDPAPNTAHWLLIDGQSLQPLADATLFVDAIHFVGAGSQADALIAAAAPGNGHKGYIDTQGRWVVPPELDDARTFSAEGLARFKRDGKWGFVDRAGTVRIEPRYRDATPFDEGLAAVSEDGERFHYIGLDGQTTIAGPFRRAYGFSNGLARVVPWRGRRDRYIDRRGKFAFKADFDSALDFNAEGSAPATADGDRWGLIDSKGRWLLEPQYRWISAFNEFGLAPFTPPDLLSVRQGYLDARGRVVIEPESNVEDRMIASCARTDHRGSQFVNDHGQLIHAEQNAWAERFSPLGMTFALRDDRWGLLRTDGHFQWLAADIVEPLTDEEGWLHHYHSESGLAPVLLDNGAVGLIDATGAIRFCQRFDADGTSTLHSPDGGGRVVWQSPGGSSMVAPHRFLSPHPEQFASPLCTPDGMNRAVDALIADAQAAFEAYAAGEALSDVHATAASSQARDDEADDEGNDDDDGADFDDDDGADFDEDDALRAYGRSRQVARAYLGEGQYGYYEFLGDRHSAAIHALHAALRERLEQRFGPSDLNPECEYDRGARFEKGAWKIGAFWLLLETNSGTGDGDVWNQIWLRARPDLDALDLARRQRAELLDAHTDDDDADDHDRAADDKTVETAFLPSTRGEWLNAVTENVWRMPEVPAELLDEKFYELASKANPGVLAHAPAWLLETAKLLDLVRAGVGMATQIPPVAFTPAAYAEAQRLYGDNDDWLDFVSRRDVPAEFDHNGTYDVLGALLDEPLCLRAAEAGGSLDDVPQWLRTPRVIQAYLDGDIFNVSHVPPDLITPELARRAACAGLLDEIPAPMITTDLCMLAVRLNGNSLENVPFALRTADICMAALDQNAACFPHVPEPTRRAVLDALIERDLHAKGEHAAAADGDDDTEDPAGTYWHYLRAYTRLRAGDFAGAIEDAELGQHAMRYPADAHYVLAASHRAMGNDAEAARYAARIVADAGRQYSPPFEIDDDTGWIARLAHKPVDVSDEAGLLERLAREPALLAQVPRAQMTAAMVDAAVASDDSAVARVPRRLLTPPLYAAAIRAGHLHIGQVPPDMLTEAACIAAVESWHSRLADIPTEWRTEAVCVAAVTERRHAIDDVPEALRTTVERHLPAALDE